MAPPTTSPVPRMLRLWLAAAAIWVCAATTAWLADWTLPQWLEGDPLEVYARVKLAQEQPVDWLLNSHLLSRLGAPGAADWSDYAVPDRLAFVLTGLLSRHTGLIDAVQLMSCVILGLNAMSFFLCARWLRCRWEWAAGLALVFAFCNYNIRWGVTLSLSQTFLLPPLILLCARAVRRGPDLGRPRPWSLLAGAMGGWMGLGNPYHAYFAGVVSGGALLLAIYRRGPRSRLMPLALFLGVMCLVFFASHATFIMRQLQGEGAQSLARGIDDLRVYALKPMDWIVPPNDHRLPALSRLGVRFQESYQARGEFFYNYLGLAGLIGLAGFFWQTLRRAWRRQWHRLDPAYFLGWLVLFGVVGGINYWIGLAGLELFRASARIGIYAHVIVFFFMSSWLSRKTRSLPRLASIILAVGISTAACWEATLPLSTRGYPANNAARWTQYERLTKRLEQALPPESAVFQLPVQPFPEAGRHFNLPDYDHFLPYLTSSRLRFSYGPMRHDPKLRWASHLETRSAKEMITALETAGFALLWIDERGYADSARALLARLHAAGATDWPRDEALPYLHLFRLQPAPQPQMPDLHDPRLLDAWDASKTTLREPRLIALQGWHQLEHEAGNSWRWAAREATLGLWHDGNPAPATLRFRLSAPAGSLIMIHQNNTELWRGSPGSETHTLNLSLAKGLNSLVWQLVGPTFRPGGHDPRELGFMVENLSVSVP